MQLPKKKKLLRVKIKKIYIYFLNSTSGVKRERITNANPYGKIPIPFYCLLIILSCVWFAWNENEMVIKIDSSSNKSREDCFFN